MSEAFQIETLSGERLDLNGTLISHSGGRDFGIVEKGVVRRAGALHQLMGPGAHKFEARCIVAGVNARAQYERIVDALTEQPEGRVTHPTHGSFRCVVHKVTYQENPGDEKDAIYFTVQISQTGLYTPPKPSAAAESAKARTKAAQAQELTADSAVDVRLLAGVLLARSDGLQTAMEAAEAGQGGLPDVDATIAALRASYEAFQSSGAPSLAKRAAAECFAAALQSRAAYQEGRPRIVQYSVCGTVSLTKLCQSLYGAKAADYIEEIKRLNRIEKPHALPDGLALQIVDPLSVLPVRA